MKQDRSILKHFKVSIGNFDFIDEIGQLKQKIIRLNEIAEHFNQNTEAIESAFNVATTGS